MMRKVVGPDHSGNERFPSSLSSGVRAPAHGGWHMHTRPTYFILLLRQFDIREEGALRVFLLLLRRLIVGTNAFLRPCLQSTGPYHTAATRSFWRAQEHTPKLCAFRSSSTRVCLHTVIRVTFVGVGHAESSGGGGVLGDGALFGLNPSWVRMWRGPPESPVGLTPSRPPTPRALCLDLGCRCDLP